MSAWIDSRNRLFGTALYAVARITSQTARFQVSGEQHLQAALSAGRPVILTAWHGMTMMLTGFFTHLIDPSKVVMPLPDDWRGEVLEVFTRKLGTTPFCMNLSGDSSLSAARRLAELIRLIQTGHTCYITPDGPDGPAYVAKPGFAYIARKAGALILPLGAYTRHGYRQPRWDRYTVPYPFCRISVCIGAPVSVPEGVELDAVTAPLETTLNRVTLQAAANYYEVPAAGRTGLKKL